MHLNLFCKKMQPETQKDDLYASYRAGYDKSIKKLAWDINSKFNHWVKKGANTYRYSKCWFSIGYFMSPVCTDSDNYAIHNRNTLYKFRDDVANYLYTKYGIRMEYCTIEYKSYKRWWFCTWQEWKYMQFDITLSVNNPTPN